MRVWYASILTSKYDDIGNSQDESIGGPSPTKAWQYQVCCSLQQGDMKEAIKLFAEGD